LNLWPGHHIIPAFIAVKLDELLQEDPPVLTTTMLSSGKLTTTCVHVTLIPVENRGTCYCDEIITTD
jgi:hypothetical protein